MKNKEKETELFHNGFMEKPKLSYSKIESKPLLANDSAIHAAVDIVNFPFKELVEFEADDKFKKFYKEEYDKEPAQEDVQNFVRQMINESMVEWEDTQAEKASEKARVQVSLNEEVHKQYEMDKKVEMFDPEKDKKKS